MPMRVTFDEEIDQGQALVDRMVFTSCVGCWAGLGHHLSRHFIT